MTMRRAAGTGAGVAGAAVDTGAGAAAGAAATGAGVSAGAGGPPQAMLATTTKSHAQVAAGRNVIVRPL